MLFGAGTVAMVGEDSGGVKRQRGGRALRELFGIGVENVGREEGDTKIAGEKIAGKQKFEALAVEAHVSWRVAGQMNCSQAMPDVDEVAVVKPAVGNEWPKR